MRRTASGIALVALVGALVLVPAAGASASVIVLQSPTDGATAVAGEVTFSGTTDDPTIDIEVRDADEVGYCTTTPAPDGSWSCVAALDPGEYEATAVQTVEMPEQYFSNTVSFTVVPPAPTADGVDTITVGDGLTASGATNWPGAVVTATVVDTGISCQDATGGPSWSCILDTQALPVGTYTVEARSAVDGLTSAPAMFAFAVEPPGVPVPEVNGPTWVHVGDAAQPNGNATPGALIAVNVVDHPEIAACGAVADPTTGAWSCLLDTTGLPIGDYAFAATATEGGVQSSPGLLSFQVVAPVDPTITCAFAPGSATITGIPWQLTNVSSVELGGTFTPTPDQRGDCGGRAGTQAADIGDTEVVGNCGPTCELGALPPGLYEVFYMLSELAPGATTYEELLWYFTIPAAPTTPTVSRVGNTATVAGSGAVPGDTVVLEGPGGATLCSAVVGAGGNWSCSFPALAAPGTGRPYQVDAASGGASAYGAAVTLPVALPVAPPTPPQIPVTGPPATTPVPPAAPLLLPIDWSLGFPAGLDALRRGDSFTITSRGLPAGTTVVITMHSTPIELLRTVVDGGPTAFEITVPDGVEDGAHRLELVATAPDGQVLLRDTAAIVVPAEPEPGDGGADVAESDPETTPTAGPTGAGADGRNDPAAPSALSDAIPTLTRVWEYPISVPLAAGLAIALLFLVAVPTELLNSTLSSNTGRLGRGFAAVERAADRARDWFIRVTRSRALAAGILVLVVSTVFGFVDPGFGFDLVSLRLVLALAIAFFLLSYGASWITGAILRRRYATHSVIQLQPSIVVFAILGVVVARLIDFSPGFLVGVVIGLELVRASRRASLAATVIQIGVVVVLAMLGWLGYSGLAAIGGPGDFASALLNDTFVALTAEGLMGALIALLPLRFLDGRELWEASKALWAAAVAVVGLAFSLLVLPTAMQGTEVRDLGVWVLVFAGFTLVVVVLWAVFARHDARTPEPDSEPEDELVS